MNLLWLDLEATGSDTINDFIMEIGAFVTDKDFVRVSDDFHAVIHLSTTGYRQLIRAGNEVVLKMHTDNGLLLESAHSDLHVKTAELQLLKLVQPHLNEHNKIRLAGSGVAAYDKPMLETHMLTLSTVLYYSSLDVGHIRRFLEYCGVDIESNKDDIPHRALQDIGMHCQEALKYKNVLRQLR